MTQWYRHYHVETTLGRRFDVITTLSLRRVSAGLGCLGYSNGWMMRQWMPRMFHYVNFMQGSATLIANSSEWLVAITVQLIGPWVNRVIIGLDNGFAPVRCQATIWTNDDLLSIEPLGTNFSEILMPIRALLSKICAWKCHLQNVVLFVRPNVLRSGDTKSHYTALAR